MWGGVGRRGAAREVSSNSEGEEGFSRAALSHGENDGQNMLESVIFGPLLEQKAGVPCSKAVASHGPGVLWCQEGL